jgi:hypothetical protein
MNLHLLSVGLALGMGAALLLAEFVPRFVCMYWSGICA